MVYEVLCQRFMKSDWESVFHNTLSEALDDYQYLVKEGSSFSGVVLRAHIMDAMESVRLRQYMSGHTLTNGITSFPIKVP